MEPSDIVLLVLGVVCPPGSVALKRGLNRDFITCVALTLFFWIPGIAYSWYLIFKYPLENFWKRGPSGQYLSIEEGLRRQSINGLVVSDEDPVYHSEEDASRSTTMTFEAPTQQQHTPPSRTSRTGKGKRPRRSRKSSTASTSKKSTSALHEAARNYALRHQHRQETNSVKKWFVDRFYFSDPTQVPPSSQSSSELRDIEGAQ
ncbi:hypothetical protein COEREDRAFT_97214 [Coemansia reversa NRRL 1564]|uniref:Uncharacterized protein n=1 Tax=Coemansia reversa (strain ATCC 12441 / NRRL 1564) TaxID=763665 RepID=A0A2G5BC88_COERN|nr:hypothetical protein COEREDRAFT_97214 [Coemansia reversa NRRL 1564]|eukprot:PIA16620.1 hypothetical protein COEREDRAFT_97214 [Coemansia reversa NRRL 1564]